MALPARLTAALGRHPHGLAGDDLQRAVDRQIPEGADLDWKKDFYQGTDAGKKELAKGVSAMANPAGGVVVPASMTANRTTHANWPPSSRFWAAVRSGSVRCSRAGSSPSYPTWACGR